MYDIPKYVYLGKYIYLNLLRSTATENRAKSESVFIHDN